MKKFFKYCKNNGEYVFCGRYLLKINDKQENSKILHTLILIFKFKLCLLTDKFINTAFTFA